MSWRIGNCIFDKTTRQVSGPVETHLNYRQGRLLEYLIENYSQPYKDKDMIRAVWEGLSAKGSLHKYIGVLRDALGGERKSFIDTDPYRLIVEPKLLDDDELTNDRGTLFHFSGAPIREETTVPKSDRLHTKSYGDSCWSSGIPAETISAENDEAIIAHTINNFVCKLHDPLFRQIQLRVTEIKSAWAKGDRRIISYFVHGTPRPPVEPVMPNGMTAHLCLSTLLNFWGTIALSLREKTVSPRIIREELKNTWDYSHEFYWQFACEYKRVSKPETKERPGWLRGIEELMDFFGTPKQEPQ